MSLFNKQNEQQVQPVVEDNLESSQTTTVEAGITTEQVITPEMQAMIDKLVEEKTQAKLAEVIPQAKKTKEEELDAKIAEIENITKSLAEKERKLEIERQLTNVAPEFKEFIAMQIETKGINVDEYLSQNPQFKAKATTQMTQTQTNENKVKLTEQQRMFLAGLKQNSN